MRTTRNARILGIALAVYAAVVFAALAGTIGAYLLEHNRWDRNRFVTSP